MAKILTFRDFQFNETLDMMSLPVDPIKGAAEVFNDIWDSVSNIWSKIIEKVKVLFNSSKDFLKKLWEIVCEISKEKWNKVSEFLFQKNIEKVELSDLNFTNVKRVSKDVKETIKDFVMDESWSFKDDVEKIKKDPLSAMEDKSLRLKTAVNKSLTLIFKWFAIPVLTTTLANLLTPMLASLVSSFGLFVPVSGVAVVVSIILTILVMIFFLWAKKKNMEFEIKLSKDLRDIPGFEQETLTDKIGRISGYEKFVKDDQHKLYNRELIRRRDELKREIAKQIIKQEVLFI